MYFVKFLSLWYDPAPLVSSLSGILGLLHDFGSIIMYAR